MAADSGKPDDLERYRAKREASRTPEPFGSTTTAASSGARGGIFVVHKHAATRLHYDFRLELDGVLVSWAVPKEPPMHHGRKGLAVRVENHPLDYASFEGVIPEGNYGAGAVIVWDRGAWVPEGDPLEGLKSGEVKFSLKGYKLRGRYTLVNTKRPRDRKQTNEWLLIKKNDEFSDPDLELSGESVLSGLTIEEMRDGPKRAQRIRDALDALGCPRRAVDYTRLRPMLCQVREEAFSDPDWIYELKYDGYRMIAAARDGEAHLMYRSGIETTDRYPGIAAAVAALPYESFIIDSELVVFDDAGRPVFNLLQQRSQVQRARDIRRLSVSLPATLAVFDLIEFEGYDLRGLPLVARKQILEMMLPSAGPLKYCDHIEEQGEAFFEQVAAMHLEGIIAKKADSTYRSARSADWLKVRVDRVDDFAIIGYTAPRGTRTAFGGLNLAVKTPDSWQYAGRVGSGLSEDELVEIKARLDALPRWKPDFEVPAGDRHTWVKPELVCAVRYREWPEGHHVRLPIFLHLREDKAPEECVRPTVGVGVDEPGEAPDIIAEPEHREIKLTNQGKVFWPESGHTKGDLVEYYRAIGPWAMPFLRDRPVVLTRYPDGIEGKSFFQKDAPKWVPAWIRTELMWSQHAEREIHYFVCDEVDVLVYLANLGTIPLHVWSSRTESLATPDWTIIDLDPKGAPFADVVKCARGVKKLCDEIGLPAYCKSSGSTGLHILIPLAQQCTYEQSRSFAHLLSRVVESRLPDVATTTRNIEARDGKVYLDWGQNGHGRLIVAPYSVRPLPGAPVSMPLRWREVTRSLDIRSFTIDNAVARMKRMRSGDPLLGVLTDKPDLVGALAALSELVEL